MSWTSTAKRTVTNTLVEKGFVLINLEKDAPKICIEPEYLQFVILSS